MMTMTMNPIPPSRQKPDLVSSFKSGLPLFKAAVCKTNLWKGVLNMQNKTIMYVGCFTASNRGGLDKGGIGVFEKAADGKWVQIQTAEQFNPSFLAFSEDKRFLYGVQGQGTEIYAYSIDENTGKLTFLNSVESGPGLAIDVFNGYIYAVAGTVQIYRINDDGSIGERVANFTPEGEIGPITGVQRGAQPHHILHDCQKQHFAVPCRGIDTVHIYKHDTSTGEIKNTCSLKAYGASYPRHIAFHPDKPIAYQLLERYGMVLTCRYEDGVLTPINMLPTVPPEFTGPFNAAGEILVHPNGKLLGISNRGHNSIVIYHIADDGTLTTVGWTTEGVSVPRFYTFDESGDYLYCANIGQSPKDCPITREADAIAGTGDITVYSVNGETGELLFTGERISIPAPSCILFKSI